MSKPLDLKIITSRFDLQKVTELCENCEFTAIGDSRLRCVKSVEEIELIQRACDIVVETPMTCLG